MILLRQTKGANGTITFNEYSTVMKLFVAFSNWISYDLKENTYLQRDITDYSLLNGHLIRKIRLLMPLGRVQQAVVDFIRQSAAEENEEEEERYNYINLYFFVFHR